MNNIIRYNNGKLYSFKERRQVNNSVIFEYIRKGDSFNIKDQEDKDVTKEVLLSILISREKLESTCPVIIYNILRHGKGTVGDFVNYLLNTFGDESNEH